MSNVEKSQQAEAAPDDLWCGTLDAPQPSAIRAAIERGQAEAAPAASAEPPLAVELQGVAEELAEGDGFWRPCSGCHETEDGHAVGNYSYSHVFKCALGSGCSECGGMGAVWDNTDYEAFGRELMREEVAQAAPAPADETNAPLTDAGLIRLAKRHGFTDPTEADGYMSLAYDKREGVESGGDLVAFARDAIRISRAAPAPEAAAPVAMIDWQAVEPRTGDEYAAGAWSRRNWEAIQRDQLAAPVASQPAQSEQSECAVVEANRKLLLDRARVGMGKYRTTLADSGLTVAQLAQHGLEEALDLANYLQALIQAEAGRASQPAGGEEVGRVKALHAAVSALYFDDSSDFRSALGSVVRHLDPKLAGDMLGSPKTAYDEVCTRLAATPATQQEADK